MHNEHFGGRVPTRNRGESRGEPPPQYAMQYPQRQARPTQGQGQALPRADSTRRTDLSRGLDVHELAKREIFASESAADDDHFEKSRPGPSSVHGFSDQVVVLDSWVKVRTSRVEAGEFQWNLMVQGVTGDEVIGVKDRIETVVKISIDPFSMPLLPDVAYAPTPTPYPAFPTGTNRVVTLQNNGNAADPLLPNSPVLVPVGVPATPYGQYPLPLLVPPSITHTPWINNPLSQTPCNGRVTVQIAEAGLQSYSDRNGARHHFELALVYPGLAGANPNLLQALPVHSEYTFTDPLRDVHNLTLVFRGPDTPLRFEPDCFYDIEIDDDAAGAPAPGQFLVFNVPGHNLNVGDRIYVTGFRSGNAALDRVVNSLDGLVASASPGTAPPYPGTGEPIPTPNQFWTDPAISVIDLTSPVPTLPATATVLIAKRRMRIPLRLRSMVPRLTNYMNP